jgi:predicted Rossmann fold flavoprotein
MKTEEHTNILIIGGGAAGFFAAANLATLRPDLTIIILERGKNVLEKVRISGGGRCNVTHACFLPKELVKFYPRGSKELNSPFHQFCSGDTIDWFEKRGVPLKIEDDGRMFPVSDSSQSIMDCLLKGVAQKNISIKTSQRADSIILPTIETNFWAIHTESMIYTADKLLIASGSTPSMWEMIKKMGHTIVPPVPSLFTFNIKDERIQGLEGVSMEKVTISSPQFKYKTEGAILITHWGVSGPAILRASAWAARELSEAKYAFEVVVNWLGFYSTQEIFESLNDLKMESPKRQITANAQFSIPIRLWKRFCEAANITEKLNYADASKKHLQALAEQLTACRFVVNGKSTFKDEFVTAGGVDLKEIDMKRFESKLHKNLFFAGEVLNIDAITGGFNFQAAWTGGFIAARSMAEKII